LDKSNRRWLVDFDPEHFGRQAERGSRPDALEVFREALHANHWGGTSRSGPGSTRAQTAQIADALPRLCERLEVRRLLDVPCGDFSWMAELQLPDVSYIGGDLVPELVEQNRSLHGGERRSFVQIDLTTSPLPAADLMLCRDCLVHLSHADAMLALRNVARGEVRWLLATTFPLEPRNVDIVTGDWRPIDLTKPPFGLPEPDELLNELCTEQAGAFADKSLGLWPVECLRARFES